MIVFVDEVSETCCQRKAEQNCSVLKLYIYLCYKFTVKDARHGLTASWASTCATIWRATVWTFFATRALPNPRYIDLELNSPTTKDAPPSGSKTQPRWIYYGPHIAKEKSYAGRKAAIFPTSAAHQVYTRCWIQPEVIKPQPTTHKHILFFLVFLFPYRRHLFCPYLLALLSQWWEDNLSVWAFQGMIYHRSCFPWDGIAPHNLKSYLSGLTEKGRGNISAVIRMKTTSIQTWKEDQSRPPWK